MKDLIREPGEKTPGVHCHYHDGVIEIRGVSMPEDAASFFFDVIEWISDYYREPQKVTEVKVALKYMNSSSSSMLFKLFYALNRLEQFDKSRVRCFWYYLEDDDETPHVADQIKTYMSNLDIAMIPVPVLNTTFSCQSERRMAG